jgi:hypothetical protein
MNTLEYGRPEKRPRISWERRYRKFVPIFGFGYCILIFAVLLEGINLADDPHPSPIFEMFFAVIGFPAFALYDNLGKGLFNFVVLGLCNAAIWGFSAVGVWHATSAISRQVRVKSS